MTKDEHVGQVLAAQRALEAALAHLPSWSELTQEQRRAFGVRLREIWDNAPNHLDRSDLVELYCLEMIEALKLYREHKS